MIRATCFSLVLLGWCSCSGRNSNAKVNEVTNWKLSGFVDSPEHQLAVVVSDDQAALVGPDGTLGTPIKLRDAGAPVIAIGQGSATAIVESDAVHLVDATTGQLRWQQKLPNVKGHGLVAIGKTTVAVGYGDGAEVLTLAAGRFVYTDQSHAVWALYFDPGGGYVLASRDELRFVEEPSGAIRWKRQVERLGESRLRGTAGKSLSVVRPDRTYEEIELAHGTTIASGNCDGVTPSVDAKEDCAGPPPTDPATESVTRVARNTQGGDYSVLRHVDHDEKKGGKATAALIARDAVGRTRWRTNWPVPFSTKVQMTEDKPSNVIAFVVSATTGSVNDARTVIAFDDANGQLLFQHPLLDQNSRLSGSAGSCWVVVTSKAVECVATRSGTTSWSTSLAGSSAAAWPLFGGQALVADGDPVALSRVGADGRSTWRITLPPGTTISAPSDTAVQQLSGPGNTAWEFSDAMGVLEVSGHLTVIDLANGKLHEVR